MNNVAVFKTSTFYGHISDSINHYTYRILDAEQRNKIAMWCGHPCNTVVRFLCFSENVITFFLSVRPQETTASLPPDSV